MPDYWVYTLIVCVLYVWKVHAHTLTYESFNLQWAKVKVKAVFEIICSRLCMY